MSHFVSGQELYQWCQKAQREARSENIPLAEIDWLVRELTDLDLISFRLQNYVNRPHLEIEMALADLEQLWQLRLKQRLPVQYLVGRCHWRNFTLKVSPDVLIPRPETEMMVDLAVGAVGNSPNPNLKSGHWVDLGTGSGAIACGLAEVFPEAAIHGVDVSDRALAIARENAASLGFGERIHFVRGSWWAPLDSLKGQISGMLANPPYIPSELVPQLQPEVARHEPKLALDGGADGLDSIRHLVEAAPLYLVPGGLWLIEIMAGQGDRVKAMLQKTDSYQQIQTHQDLAGIERFVLAFVS